LGTGNLTQSYNSPIARDQPILLYGRVDPKTEGFVRYAIEEVSTPFIAFQRGVDVITTGTVTAPSQELNPLANNHQVVIDRLILPSEGRNYSLKVGTLRIVGTNRFGSGGITVTGTVEVAAGARIDGYLSLGSAGSSLKIMDNVVFTGGRITGFAGGGLAVTVIGSFLQLENDSVFDAGGHSLTIFGTGGTVRLTNPRNVFGKVGVELDGSNLSLVSSDSLVFSSLRTGGGWVMLSSRGSITAVENVAAGNLSFRAAGAVTITGAYSGASGYGSTISLNSSSTAVVQSLGASTAISLAGTGTVILSGNLTSSGSIDISAPIGVSGNAEISANGGWIRINSTIDAISSALTSSLRLNAGSAGMVSLGGDIGSRIHLGWVAIDAGILNNPASHRISIKGASFTPHGPLDERGLRYGL
ncbi:MAG: hypothetical protein ORO03_10390, partial [Alphaproteobacteria bacterium]|nr:hypothetical protein [Alphaproteobacteria bacterium]